MNLDIIKPRITKTLNADETEGVFCVEPLERGFGTTIGSTLNRIMYGNLAGVAVVKFVIRAGKRIAKNNIDGIYEDLRDIIMNLKGIVAGGKGGYSKKAQLQVEGPCEVKAKDFHCDDDLFIQNKNHHILTVSKKIHVSMELTFASGHGYVSAETNKLIYSTGNPEEVFIDSIFTPVVSMDYSVVNARVKNSMQYDKLTINVKTNGSIKATDAIATAGKLFVGKLSLFDKSNGTVNVFADDSNANKAVNAEMGIDFLDLSVRSYNALRRARIMTIEELTKKTKNELLRIRNLGIKSYDEIVDKIENLGYSFKEEE